MGCRNCHCRRCAAERRIVQNELLFPLLLILAVGTVLIAYAIWAVDWRTR